MIMLKAETVDIKTTKPFFVPEKHPRWLRKLEYFIRVRIFRQRRYLIDKWTIVEIEDLEPMHGLDLEEELTKALIEEIERTRNDHGTMTVEEYIKEMRRY